MGQERYTLIEIRNALEATIALETGRHLVYPVNPDLPDALLAAQTYLSKKLLEARIQAQATVDLSWEQPLPGAKRIDYDERQVAAILDKLGEAADRKGLRSIYLTRMGINPTIIELTERILFKISPIV